MIVTFIGVPPTPRRVRVCYDGSSVRPKVCLTPTAFALAGARGRLAGWCRKRIDENHRDQGAEATRIAVIISQVRAGWFSHHRR